MKLRAILLALVLAGCGSQALPRCPEDSVLVGVGSFENGRWSSYECGPAYDDVAP